MAVVWKSVWLLCLLMTTLSVNAQTNDTSAQGMDESYGGADAAGGQQLNEAGSSQQQCRQETKPSTMQVFSALLEPVNTPNGQEAAQDAPRGMMTMYVDSRSGQAWVAGSVNNIHNLTAVTLNAGNSTQVGPVLLPLLPSSARAAQSPQAQANNGQGSDSQDGQESISPFSPPLPWLANMAFSDRIALSDILPLTSNASLNTSGSNASASAGPINYGAYNNNGGSSSQGAQANMGVPLNASGNLVGAQPFSYVNVTDLDRQLSQVGLVTVMTVFLPDGTTITSFNITNTTDNATTNNATTNSAGNQGGNSPITLMQAGLAYVSVHTSQSGQSPELRGQLVPYGKVLGNSAAIANLFPDNMAPNGTYTTTVCTNATTKATPGANATSSNNYSSAGVAPAANATSGSNYSTAGAAEEAGTRAQNLLANSTFTNLAAQTMPPVRTALTNITSSARNLNGSYATFSAVVQAAEAAVNNSRNNAAGRRLLQSGSTSGNTNGSDSQLESGSTGGNTSGSDSQLQSGSTGGNTSASDSQSGITVFAPSDKAIQTYLQQQGLTQQQLLGNQQQLVELISYHIVPSHTLSARYLSSRSNGTLPTLLPNNTLGFMAIKYAVAGNTSTTVLLRDASGNVANIRDPNMSTGRVWIHGVDRVLVPKTRSNNSQNAGNAGMNGSQNAGNAGMNGSLESGNAGMNGGASASAGGANAATTGTVSPNGADVATSGSSGNGGGRRLFMRAHNTLFEMAHNAHLV